MLDVQCEACGEPWDPWGIVYDEGLPFDAMGTLSALEWEITWGSDRDAAASGELRVHRCPCCKENKEGTN